MFRRVFVAAALAASFSFPALAEEPQAPHAHWCMLSSFQVSQVASLYSSTHAERSTERLIGAQLFVPAQPGLTAEWIQANLARHSGQAPAQRSTECPLDVPGASMNVVSGGTGFWIQISSADPAVAGVILKRAKESLH